MISILIRSRLLNQKLNTIHNSKWATFTVKRIINRLIFIVLFLKNFYHKLKHLKLVYNQLYLIFQIDVIEILYNRLLDVYVNYQVFRSLLKLRFVSEQISWKTFHNFKKTDNHN